MPVDRWLSISHGTHRPARRPGHPSRRGPAPALRCATGGRAVMDNAAGPPLFSSPRPHKCAAHPRKKAGARARTTTVPRSLSFFSDAVFLHCVIARCCALLLAPVAARCLCAVCGKRWAAGDGRLSSPLSNCQLNIRPGPNTTVATPPLFMFTFDVLGLGNPGAACLPSSRCHVQGVGVRTHSSPMYI